MNKFIISVIYLVIVLQFETVKLEKTKSRSELPTVYNYFTKCGIRSGLVAEKNGFKLNKKDITIISGEIHYARVHPELWRDRLKKLRALGANTVDTFIPWNLHEPLMGQFDFGNGGNEMSQFLNLRKFLKIAQEEDLLVSLRPGPYICGEWEFGGFPSWLLRDPNMKVRENNQPYLDRVKIYLDQLLPHLADLQFIHGGPIIALQIENEYASFNKVSKKYLKFVYELFESHGFVNNSLLFTSDASAYGDRGSLSDKLLLTANFQFDPDRNLKWLKEAQPDKPVMAMEFWIGWFDNWFNENHRTYSVEVTAQDLEIILGPKWNGSVNIYMFHGGTTFGFMNGANWYFKNENRYGYGASTTSYDYDALLTEAGDYTEKYKKCQKIIKKYQKPKIKQTEMIPESKKRVYPSVAMQSFISYEDLLEQVPSSAKFKMDRPVPMEHLPINSESGQSYGYVIYRKRIRIAPGSIFRAGPVKDFGMILIDGKLQPTGYQTYDYWINETREFPLVPGTDFSEEYTLDLFIENMGRVNFGADHHFLQYKGLYNAVFTLNGEDLTDVEIISLEFKSKWVHSFVNWMPIEKRESAKAPVLLQTSFEIKKEEIADTFLDMRKWHKGIVFVNGFHIGRYFKVGPQQTLYIPAPLLKAGENTITIFEQLEPATQIEFVDKPVFNF